jgi:uncharacterized phage-like protein YoqJ
MLTVSFTGHRCDKIGGWNLPNPTYNYICQEIEKVLKELKPDKVISGMAAGVDQWGANIAYKLGIPFIAAIPHIGQESIWPKTSQDIYRKLLSRASEVVIVSEGGYAAWKMQARNQWMVDNSDKVIAIFKQTETNGGTFNCVQYALSVKKDIYYINPKDAP